MTKFWPSDWEPPYDPDRLPDDILVTIRQMPIGKTMRILNDQREMTQVARKLGYVIEADLHLVNKENELLDDDLYGFLD